MTMLRSFLRYFAALIILMYGFAKINGAQFTILDSALDQPMGHVSGFWLTWYYFGYSPFYGSFLALVQIAGALLLTFQRTTLLGACILAPMLGNIVLIDIFYGVEPSALLVAFLLLLAMIALILPHGKQLAAILLPSENSPTPSGAYAAAQWGVRIAMLSLTCALTYWIANYNNRAPTPIDGTWDVIPSDPELPLSVPKTLFFEHNRANMAVFKTVDAQYKTHRFEVDRDKRQIHITESWLEKGR